MRKGIKREETGERGGVMAEVKGAAKSLKCCVNIRLVRIRIAESESKVFLRFKHLKDTKMRTIIYKNGIFRVFAK